MITPAEVPFLLSLFIDSIYYTPTVYKLFSRVGVPILFKGYNYVLSVPNGYFGPGNKPIKIEKLDSERYT